jgi:hypothetical protein
MGNSKSYISIVIGVFKKSKEVDSVPGHKTEAGAL